MGKKHTYRRLPLTPEQWETIKNLPWPNDALREVLDRIRAQDGNGLATEILDGHLHRRIRINKMLAGADLPYRLLRYELPKEQIPDRPKGRIETLGVTFCTRVTS